MQVNNYSQSKQNVSFGKVIRIKVFIDGLPTVSEANVRKATRALSGILQKHNTGHPQAAVFIKTFRQSVHDYIVPAHKVDSRYPIIRPYIKDSLHFLFTGVQAQVLNPMAKEIGLDRVNSAKKALKYFDKARSFIRDFKLRIMDSTKPEGELELRIYTTGKGNPLSEKFKLQLDEIMFRKEGDDKVFQPLLL